MLPKKKQKIEPNERISSNGDNIRARMLRVTVENIIPVDKEQKESGEQNRECQDQQIRDSRDDHPPETSRLEVFIDVMKTHKIRSIINPPWERNHCQK